MSLKHKLSSVSPLKIGFIASFVLHSSLFAFLVVDFRRIEHINSMSSQALSLSLENISGEAIDSRKSKKMHKKHRHHHRKHKKSFVPAEKQMKEEEMQEVAESVDSDLDSTMGASANLGAKVEILGTGDALYATILDIINKNRHYPKIARALKLQDRVKMEFILLSSGEVVGIRVIAGRHSLLNDDAIKTIKRSVGQFPKIERSKKVRVNVVYEIDS